MSQSHSANRNIGRVPQRQGQFLLNTLESFRNACRWGQIRKVGGWCVSVSVHSSVLATMYLHPAPPQKYHRWVQCMALVSETAELGVCINSENFVTPEYVSHEICLGPISLFHVFGLWGTAWNSPKLLIVWELLEGMCETRFLCYAMWFHCQRGLTI